MFYVLSSIRISVAFSIPAMAAVLFSMKENVKICLKMELVEIILDRDFISVKMEKLTVTAWKDGSL